MAGERILGVDISLNHAGLFMLNEQAKPIALRFVTPLVSVAKAHPKYATYIKAPEAKNGDKSAHSIARLLWWFEYLGKLFKELKPTHVGIEDYAMRAESNAVYQIGEQGGIARLKAIRNGAKLRLHDPCTVKMFGALSGTATPWDLSEAVKDRFGLDMGVFDPPDKPGKKQNMDVRFDLCSSFVLARLVWTEIQLRNGKTPAELGLTAKEMQAFNRVTKTYPVNILGREWIGDSESAIRRSVG